MSIDVDNTVSQLSIAVRGEGEAGDETVWRNSVSHILEPGKGIHG